MARTTMMGWWAPKVWTTSLVILMLSLSAFVLSQTVLFTGLVDLMASAGGVSRTLITVLLLLPIVLLFAMTTVALRKGARMALAASWIMIAPAILSFSGIDWLAVFNSSGSGGNFDVNLPSAVVIAIAVGLSATCLCQRSYSQVASIRMQLTRRGIDDGEVDAATAKMFASMSSLAIVATMASVAVLAGGMALTSLGGNVSDALLIGAVVVVAVVGALMISRRMLVARHNPSIDR